MASRRPDSRSTPVRHDRSSAFSILFVTGIPQTEAQSIRSTGEAYRAHAVGDGCAHIVLVWSCRVCDPRLLMQAGRTLGDRSATGFGATTAAMALLAGMKKTPKTSTQNRTTLILTKETLRTLNNEDLEIVQGGMMRTTFSCVNLCISINAC